MCQNGGISPFGEGGLIRLPNYYSTKYLVKASICTKYMQVHC